LVEVVEGHENLQREEVTSLVDYVDIVTMANLQMQGTAKFVSWDNVNASKRLGFSSAESQNFLTAHAEELAKVRNMLGV
jgi:hypothetical protein